MAGRYIGIRVPESELAPFFEKHLLRVVKNGRLDRFLMLIFNGRMLTVRGSELELRFFFGWKHFGIQARPTLSGGRWQKLDALLPPLAAGAGLKDVLKLLDENWSRLIALESRK